MKVEPVIRLISSSALSLCLLACVQCTTERPRESFGRAGAQQPSGGTTPLDSGTTRDAQVVSDAETGSDANDVQDDAGMNAPDAAPPDASAPDAGESDPVEEACGEPPRVTGDFSRERLRSASADCAVWHYCAFGAVAERLETTTAAYASERGDMQRTAARAAFRDAMRSWSRAELFQFGPAASAAQSAGKDIYQGKGLRDLIYAWPATARCRVEEQILQRTTNLSSALISGRGLFAIEYALFYEGQDTACPVNGASAQAWNALSDEQRAEYKADYAAAVAKDIRAQATALIAAWSESGGNFKPSFVSASGYPNEQEALNVLGWSLIYIEREVKDWKLGIPAGYTMTAPVTGPETPFAKISSDALRANLLGFRALFQGCGADGSGLGFDDWLAMAGHQDLADAIIAAYGEAETTLQTLPQLDVADAAQLEAAYQALRKLTTLLKSDLFGAGSPLNLKLPATVEGDTD